MGEKFKKKWSDHVLPQGLGPATFLNTLESELQKGFRINVLCDDICISLNTNLSDQDLVNIFNRKENTMLRKKWTDNILENISLSVFLNTLDSEFAESYRTFVRKGIMHILLCTTLHKEEIDVFLRKARDKM